jgi:hypothetical protein
MAQTIAPESPADAAFEDEAYEDQSEAADESAINDAVAELLRTIDPANTEARATDLPSTSQQPPASLNGEVGASSKERTPAPQSIDLTTLLSPFADPSGLPPIRPPRNHRTPTALSSLSGLAASLASGP